MQSACKLQSVLVTFLLGSAGSRESRSFCGCKKGHRSRAAQGARVSKGTNVRSRGQRSDADQKDHPASGPARARFIPASRKQHPSSPVLLLPRRVRLTLRVVTWRGYSCQILVVSIYEITLRYYRIQRKCERLVTYRAGRLLDAARLLGIDSSGIPCVHVSDSLPIECRASVAVSTLLRPGAD
jgi:hypothetical protein